MQILEAAFEGLDVLGLLPTGSGKTISFWGLPLLIDYIFNGDPRTDDRIDSTSPDFIKPILFVISPLNNLMQEQCRVFSALSRVRLTGLRATFLSSEQKDTSVLSDVRMGVYQIVYLSPERAAKELQMLFSSKLVRSRTCAVAVDEAHCILFWGKSFRTYYAQLYRVRATIGMKILWILLSATLTLDERLSVIGCVGLRDPVVVERPANRPNIFYNVCDWFAEKWMAIIVSGLIREQDKFPRRVVFSRTKEEGTTLSLAIANGIGQLEGKTQSRRVLHLHADLSAREKEYILDDFMKGIDSECRVLVSSLLFSLGTDPKALYDVDIIGQPTELSLLYQQLGRPGRDGLPSIGTLHIGAGRQYGTKPCMKPLLARKKCMRMVIVRHFNPTFTTDNVWPTLPGADDSEKARNCCSVCRKRGTLSDEVKSSESLDLPDEIDNDTDNDERDSLLLPILQDNDNAVYVYNPRANAEQ